MEYLFTVCPNCVGQMFSDWINNSPVDAALPELDKGNREDLTTRWNFTGDT